MESTFRKDVIDDIQWEKDNINHQIEMLEPMKNALHQSAGMKMLSTGGYLFTELVLWLLAIATIVYVVFAFNMTPFYELSNALNSSVRLGELKDHEMITVFWSIRSLIVLIAILIIIIARQLAKLRKKMKMTNVAGKTISDMQKKLEERMSTLLAFEQKYSYLLDKDITIELDQFANPIQKNDDEQRLLPPKGDIFLD